MRHNNVIAGYPSVVDGDNKPTHPTLKPIGRWGLYLKIQKSTLITGGGDLQVRKLGQCEHLLLFLITLRFVLLVVLLSSIVGVEKILHDYKN